MTTETPPAEMNLPLSFHPITQRSGLILDGNGTEIANDAWTPVAKAIVASVNRHAELVEALKELFAAAEWYRRAEGHEDAHSRWIRAEEAVKALTEPLIK